MSTNIDVTAARAALPGMGLAGPQILLLESIISDLINAEPNPYIVQKELFELLVKAGRRCAYDLKHAFEHIPKDDVIKPMLEGRAEMWLRVFNPDGGVKDYRADLHRDLDRVTTNYESAVRLLDEHKIPNDFDIDFFRR
jgi:hypothetical protein